MAKVTQPLYVPSRQPLDKVKLLLAEVQKIKATVAKTATDMSIKLHEL